MIKKIHTEAIVELKEIEHKIACSEMSAAQVFTQMKQHIPVGNKQEFTDQWVISFLATWTANRYEVACVSGEHGNLSDPPIEDAKFLAEKQWHKFKGT